MAASLPVYIIKTRLITFTFSIELVSVPAERREFVARKDGLVRLATRDTSQVLLAACKLEMVRVEEDLCYRQIRSLSEYSHAGYRMDKQMAWSV